MNTFEKGDRVEYTGTLQKIRELGTLTVAGPHPFLESRTKIEEGEQFSIHNYNLRHVTPTPSLITIDRADLPEIVINEAGWIISDNNYLAHIDSAKPEVLRSIALQYLAATDFLEAREKAAQDAEAAEDAAAKKVAADKLRERRQKLAINNSYYDLLEIVIELQDAAK